MRNSIWLRGSEVLFGIWPLLNSPRSRTSKTAKRPSEVISSASSLGEIVFMLLYLWAVNRLSFDLGFLTVYPQLLYCGEDEFSSSLHRWLRRMQ